MRPVKLIRQTIVTECGICCLAMVASYYGRKETISFYRNMFSVGRDGTSLKELFDYFNSIGIAVRVFRAKDIADFSFQKKKPYVIYCKNNHYCVVQYTGKDFLLSDPSSEQQKISVLELQNHFNEIIVDPNPTDAFVRRKGRTDEFRYVKTIIKENARLLLLSLACTVLSSAIVLLIPHTLQLIVNTINAGANGIDYLQLLLKVLVLLLVYCISSYFQIRVNILLESGMANNISKKTILHLLKIPYSYFDNRSNGNILYRLGILDYLRDVISSGFVGFLIDITTSICILLYIIYCIPSLFLDLVALTSIITLYTFAIYKKEIKLQRAELSSSEKVTELRTEIVSNIFQIKCLRLETFFWNNFKHYFDSFIGTFKKERLYSSKVTLGYSAINIFAPIIIVIHAAISNNTVFTPGTVIFIYSLLGMLTNSLYNMFTKATTILQLKSVVFYLNDMLDEPENARYGQTDLQAFNTLEMKDISFHYTKRSPDVLKNLDLSVERGNKIAVVGLTGSGKTTMVKLLANLYEPSSGEISINGIPLNDISNSSIAKAIAIVPQIPIVFNKSIRENITLGDKSCSDEDVLVALAQSCFLDDVLKMPLGLNTVVSGEGGNLSGGQIQRLALSRALIRRPELLILDEATSSLDASTENAIFHNLKNIGVSLLVISHRLSTIMDSDYIYYIGQDANVTKGTHQWLMENEKAYKELFLQQMDGLDTKSNKEA